MNLFTFLARLVFGVEKHQTDRAYQNVYRSELSTMQRFFFPSFLQVSAVGTIQEVELTTFGSVFLF